MRREILYLDRVSTARTGERNLERLSLSLEEGEAVTIVGRDDSGVDVLCEVLTGRTRPKKGRILLNGSEVVLHSAQEANAHGVFLIQSDNAIIPELTVAENLNVLKGFSWNDFIIRPGRNIEKTRKVFEKYGITMEAEQSCRNLTQAQSMMLQMCKAVLHGALVLICKGLGEEFSTEEIRQIDGLVNALKAEGISLIIIGSDIRKMAPVADRVQILRNGIICYDKLLSEARFEEMNRYMEIDRREYAVERRDDAGVPLFEFLGFETDFNRGRPVDFSVRSGETMGLFWTEGTVGDGVFRAFAGDARTRATVVTRQEKAQPFSSWLRENRHHIYCLGMHFWEQNLIQEFTLREHLALRFYFHFDRPGWISRRQLATVINDFVRDRNIPEQYLDCVPRHIPTEIKNRIVLWMTLIFPPRLLVLDNPLFGADGQMQQLLFACLEEVKRNHTAVLWSNNSHSALKNLCERVQTR